MPEFSLQEITKITNGKLYGNPKQIITRLETDSRKASQNNTSVFFAIRGIHHNGHHFIPQLIKQGLKNFIVEEINSELQSNPELNIVKVVNCLTALQQIAAAYRSSLHTPVVAITGSNGKTVVKEWLAQCLAQLGKVSRSPKSYNSQLGVPLSIWMINPESEWSIIEAGISLPGEMTKLESIIQPTYGIITNIGPAHQENFESINQKVREKIDLFKHTEVLYYCSDHTEIQELLQNEFSSITTISWSMHNSDAHLFVTETLKLNKKTQLNFKFAGNEHKLIIPFTDSASLENCLHIISFLLHQKRTIEEVQYAIKQLTPVAMRLEQLRGIRNSTLINDSYNSDLHSLRIALDYLSTQIQHKKHSLILSDIKQSGQDTETLYKAVNQLINDFQIDQLILVGENISSNDSFTKSALRFKSTADLLRNIHRIEIEDHALLIKGAREFGFENIVKYFSEKKHTTVLEINLNYLIENLNYFRGLISENTMIMVMVKALSYGSGQYEIASFLQHQKIDYLGVAFTDEGVALREAGIGLPIMVMSPSLESIDKIIEYNLEPEVYSFRSLQAVSTAIEANQLQEYPVHIKLDTGMHRLGFLSGEIEQLALELKKYSNIHVKTIFSHLAVSDSSQHDSFTHLQIEQFNKMYSYLVSQLKYKPIRHMLNSAGIERFPEAHFEMVRLGIGLHGISGKGVKLKAVSTLKTRIVQIKNIPKSDTIGYNRRGILTRNSKIAIIPVGYADGLDRKLGNLNGFVVINRQTAKFIGDICMDLSMIDITEVNAREGDEVIIFGKENPIQELARQVGTIPYEILTNVSERVKRVYLNE